MYLSSQPQVPQFESGITGLWCELRVRPTARLTYWELVIASGRIYEQKVLIIHLVALVTALSRKLQTDTSLANHDCCSPLCSDEAPHSS